MVIEVYNETKEIKNAKGGNRTLTAVKLLVFETSAYTSSATLANLNGGVEGFRTPDLLHAMQALYQTELQPRIRKPIITPQHLFVKLAKRSIKC